jgi:hypothetical protein
MKTNRPPAAGPVRWLASVRGAPFPSRRPARPSLSARAVDNLRAGRLQRTLSALTALCSAGLAFEIYLEHYKGSFGDKWMWTPIVLTPPLVAAGVAGVVSERAARSVLPAVSVLYCLDGVIGVITHIQGVRRKPGGFHEPVYNLVMGPPLLAPGSLLLVGGFGLAAPLMQRER